MSDWLEEIGLVDPETREPLRAATTAELDALRARLRGGQARRSDGSALPEAIDGAYLDPSRRRAYPVEGGIPCFLVELRIELDPPLEVDPSHEAKP